MEESSTSVHNEDNTGDGCIVRNNQVCKTEDDDIGDPFHVKQEPIKEDTYVVGLAVPYGGNDILEPRNVKTECESVRSECSMDGIVKQEPAEEELEGDVRYSVRCEEIDIVYEPDEPSKQLEIEYDRVKSECSTDPVAASSSNCNEEVLLPECSKQSTKDRSDSHNEDYSSTKVVKSNTFTKVLGDETVSEHQEDSTTFECSIYMKTFTDGTGLAKHELVHSRKKPYVSNVSMKKFTATAHLKSHNRMQSGKEYFECHVCMKKFNKVGNLNRHKRIHSGDKPFECDVCMKKFTETAHLKSHKRIHSGEKPFKCDICMKKFSHSLTLNTHKRIHSGEKPFECDVCLKKFSRLENMNVHKRVHSGEKPFKCSVCSKKFTHRSSFNRHTRIHAGE